MYKGTPKYSGTPIYIHKYIYTYIRVLPYVVIPVLYLEVPAHRCSLISRGTLTYIGVVLCRCTHIKTFSYIGDSHMEVLLYTGSPM